MVHNQHPDHRTEKNKMLVFILQIDVDNHGSRSFSICKCYTWSSISIHPRLEHKGGPERFVAEYY